VCVCVYVCVIYASVYIHTAKKQGTDVVDK